MTGFGCGGTGWEELGGLSGGGAASGAITIDAGGGSGGGLTINDSGGNGDVYLEESAGWAVVNGVTGVRLRNNGTDIAAVTASALSPWSPATYSLGGTANEWVNLYLSAGIYFGTAQDVLLSRGAAGRLDISDPTNSANATLLLFDSAGTTYGGLAVGSSLTNFYAASGLRAGLSASVFVPASAGGLGLGSTTEPWGDAHLAGTAQGAALQIKSASQELTGLSGASASTTNLVPAGCTILYVVARVTTLITGATTFDVGDGSDVDRYGAAIALAAGTTVDETDGTADPRSWSASAQDVTLTANGSNFTGGAVRITAFYLDPTAPTS